MTNWSSTRLIKRGAPWAFLGALILMGPLSSQSEEPSLSHPVDRLGRAVEILSHLPSGRKLLERAGRFWKLSQPLEVRRQLHWGKASKTDAVLTRHFNPKTGEETRERQVTIFLRESQSLDELVLDIAHELVHATSRPVWDPYDPNLTPGKYIWAAIEGEGGEVDAVVEECKIGFELHERYGAGKATQKRCIGYLVQERLDASRVRRDFYRVGSFTQDLKTKLGAERSMFPLLSSEPPRLYSSTGNAPYPVALYQEFRDLTAIACENSRRRVSSSSMDRSPASVARSAAYFVEQRCRESSSASSMAY